MAFLLEVPLDHSDSSEVLLVEVDAEVVPGELVLASDAAGKAAARARKTLEEAMAELRPSLERIVASVRSLGPQETQIEFGLKLGGETGVIVAKGTAEVNFKVTMTWK